MSETAEQISARVTKLFSRIGLQPNLTQEFAEAVERTLNSHRAWLGWPLVEVCSTPDELIKGVLKFKLKE